MPANPDWEGCAGVSLAEPSLSAGYSKIKDHRLSEFFDIVILREFRPAGSLDLPTPTAKARLVNARAPASPVLSPRRSCDAQGSSASGMVVAPGHQRW